MLSFILNLLFFLALGAAMFLYFTNRGLNKHLNKIISELLSTNQDMYKTLAMGLYHRYRKREQDEPGETPVDFERLVAEIMRRYYGGTVFVSGKPGDGGVDIEHQRPDGLYLGQVKCYRNDVGKENNVPFEPIAIIHSQMVLRNAKGGFVVTTSGFTPAAVEYARRLNIELIDEHKLVEYWAKGFEEMSRTTVPAQTI